MAALRKMKNIKVEAINTSRLVVFPDDIVSDILQRLPVTSLVRFKIVCKTWYDLFSDLNFVKSQLEQANKGHRVNCLHLDTRFIINCKNLQHNDSVKVSSVNSGQTESQRSVIDFPSEFLSSESYIHVLGSCNGLLLLIRDPFETTFLWNPSTRRCKTFTQSDFHLSLVWHECITGFGYDTSRDEYKGVIIQKTSPSFRMIVFSSKDGKWKDVEGTRSLPIRSSVDVVIEYLKNGNIQGVTVNGAPHWILFKRSNDDIDHKNRIMYFDVADGKFKMLSTPNIAGGILIVPPLFLLEGYLCVVCYEKADGQLNAWAMKEYGDESSWTKLFAITYAANFLPLGFLKTGDGRDLLSCHLRDDYCVSFNVKIGEKSRKTKIDSIDEYKYSKLVSYVETLVSP